MAANRPVKGLPSSLATMPSLTLKNCTVDGHEGVTVTVRLPSPRDARSLKLFLSAMVARPTPKEPQPKATTTTTTTTTEDLPVGQLEAVQPNGEVLLSVDLRSEGFEYVLDENVFTLTLDGDTAPFEIVILTPRRVIVAPRYLGSILPRHPGDDLDSSPSVTEDKTSYDLDRFLLPHARRRITKKADLREDIGIYSPLKPGANILAAGDEQGFQEVSLDDVHELVKAVYADHGRPYCAGVVRAFREVVPTLGAPPMLSRSQCQSLIAILDHAHSVNSQEDTQLALSLSELEQALGPNTVAEMAREFDAVIRQVKLRRVEASPAGRTFIDFHLDKAAKTMGLPLNDASEYGGSRLVYLIPERGVVVANRTKAGGATVHDNTIPHAVTPILTGVRYSLFLLS